MANPDQEKILLKPTYEVVKSICSKFQDESGSTDFFMKKLNLKNIGK